jgi:hypothetical protein
MKIHPGFLAEGPAGAMILASVNSLELIFKFPS